ncbi:hypothetical protein RhiirA4_480838 [Rhizophagus irregularis]|uniref:Uncharacterized protein n=1 Tax=Rhizophagus irregularis TaxID=588596 RepID=A0A2I1HIK7_9GLOM|nr:hypothetical protein RhiirA4_480838 [Rhizophagus irregularis]
MIPSKEQGDRIASLCLANPSTRVLQLNFQKDGKEDEDEEEDGEKDEEEDEDNVTNNNANYAAKENYSENNCDYSNDFIESHTKCWLLSSGIDVLNVLLKYEKTVPKNQKCLNPICWDILDLTSTHPETKALYSPEDWIEMVNNFEQEVKLTQTDISNIMIHFFDEVNQIVKNNHDLTMEIDRLFLEVIEKKYNIILNIKEKANIFVLKCAIVTYIKNLKGTDLLVLESDFDNSFSNMFIKRFLDQDERKNLLGFAQHQNESHSVILHARIGQKCDFRGILKNSIDKLEAIVGLRSSGLLTAYQ